MKLTRKQARELFFDSQGIEPLQKFVDNGGDLSWSHSDFDGRTLLFFAAMSNKEDQLQWLLEHRADPNACDFKTQETVLHAAVSQYGKSRIVKRLLEGGADINAVNKWGWSALHEAAYSTTSEPPIVGVLIKAGADVTLRSLKPRANYGDARVVPGSLAIHAALVANNQKAMKTLYPHQGHLGIKKADTLLIHAVAYKASSKSFLVDFLVKKLKEDPNAQNDFGWTALHYACHDFVHVDAVKKLLKSGADPGIGSTKKHKKMPVGAKPLDVARASGKVSRSLAKLLEG